MRHIALALCLMSGAQVMAQQVPMYTQYMLNDYVVNPAIAGTRDYFDGKYTHRNQWVGIEDAPRTSVLSVNGPLKTRNMGMGGLFINDRNGHVTNRGFYVSYSYVAKLSEEAKISFGLNMGGLNYIFDGTKIILEDAGDEVMSQGVQSSTVPDATFGFHLYGKKFFVGTSVHHLFNNKLKFFSSGINGDGRLTRHVFFTGGYNILPEGSKFTYHPYMLVKFASPVPVQYDLGIKASYDDKAWLGAAYRSEEAFSVLFGVTFLDNLSLGYSYDFMTSDLKNYSRGSHEIMLGIKFQRSFSKKG